LKSIHCIFSSELEQKYFSRIPCGIEQMIIIAYEKKVGNWYGYTNYKKCNSGLIQVVNKAVFM